MPIVESPSGLVSVRRMPTLTEVSSGGLTYSTPWGGSYANLQCGMIYATQPNVRTCVDFLARGIGQLGLHVFRRVSDTDRVRLADHQLADWLGHPNPDTTTYRLWESTVADLGIYFEAYWLKTPVGDGGMRLVRLPPEQMTVEGGLLRSGFTWTYEGQTYPLQPDEVVYFNGYNPLDPLRGLSPLFTLQRILAEDVAAGQNREQFWRNASRVEGIIERPREAPKWTKEQKQQWREQWQARYHGAQSAGAVAILEDGMTFKQVSWSAKDSEYLGARKLTRTECAAAYHIPPPFVGDLEHATFSNIKEQHKQLYQDTLGPWLEMLQEGIELMLLPDCRDTTDIYVEFNIAEKMKGAFEEQSASLSVAVRRAFMTANEARARLNLPRIDDPSADQLAAQQGGPATATDATLPPPDGATTALMPPPEVAAIVRAHLERQASRLARYATGEEKAAALDVGRCVGELTDDLAPIVGVRAALVCAARVTEHTHALLLDGRNAFSFDREVVYAA
jgi:HK97 family phage portal protein